MTNLIGINTEYKEEVDGIIRKHTQNLPQDFIDGLKERRNESTKQREGEYMHVASIPTIVIEQWLREGFKYWEATGPEIMKRLRDQNLDAFITTDKRV